MTRLWAQSRVVYTSPVRACLVDLHPITSRFFEANQTHYITRAQQSPRRATVAATDMGAKRGGYCAPFADSCTEVYFRTKWRLHPSSRLATIEMGQKLGGGGCALCLVVARSPSNTKSPGPRPSSTPSGILVHPAVWPQRTMDEN